MLINRLNKDAYEQISNLVTDFGVMDTSTWIRIKSGSMYNEIRMYITSSCYHKNRPKSFKSFFFTCSQLQYNLAALPTVY